MNIKLREIAGKPAGTYFVTTDNSQVPTIEELNKLRLLFINSETGPVNTIVVFSSGDKIGFNSIFGKSIRKNERNGNYSIKTAEDCLEQGPLAVLNLRGFTDEDTSGIVGISPNPTLVEEKTIEYSKLFNTNNFWTINSKNIVNNLTSEHLLNIANVGTNNISIFVTVSSELTVAKITPEQNLTLSECSLDIDEYPGLNFDMLLGETFVDVTIFNNTFDPSTVGTNKYYGHLFDSEGCIELSDIEKLKTIKESGYVRTFTGTIIPGLKIGDEDISIDSVMNKYYVETGIISFINDEVLEVENINIIDIDGNTYTRDESGNLISSVKTMFSHIVPENILKSKAIYPPTSAADLVQKTTDIIEHEVVSISEVEFETAFEQGIRIGDKFHGESGTFVEVESVEIIAESVPF